MPRPVASSAPCTCLLLCGGRVANTLTCFPQHSATTDDFLATISTGANLIWRNWAIVIGFCFINIAGAIGLYWLARVPKGARKSKKDKKE